MSELDNTTLLRCRKSQHELDPEHAIWRMFDKRIGHHHDAVPKQHAVGPHPLCRRCWSDENRIAQRKLRQLEARHAHQ